jgi:ABC-type branched-subunit amino acid transport system substrate-binding protein
MKRNQKQHAKRQRHKEAKASEVQAVYSEDGKLAKQIVKQNQVSGDDFLGDISQPAQKSVLFQQYRALGYYASDLPLSIVKSDQDILIASAVGEHAFYVYDSAHLNLAYMSKFISDTITFI